MGLGAPQEKGLPVAAKGKGKQAKRDYNRAYILENWQLFDNVPTNPSCNDKGERATQEHIEKCVPLGGEVGLVMHLLETVR